MVIFGWMQIAVEEGVPLYCWHPLWIQGEILAVEQGIDRRVLQSHLDIGVSVSAPEDEDE